MAVKRYEINIVVRDPDNAMVPKSIDKIENDSLLIVLSQFPIIIGQITNREINQLKREVEGLRYRMGLPEKDDDIPF